MIIDTVSPAYNSVLHTTFQQLRAASSEGILVAMTSATSGEGVTHSITALVNALSKDGSKRILHVHACNLQQTTCAPASLFRFFKRVETNIFDYDNTLSNPTLINSNNTWSGNWQYRRDCIQHLRASFDYILIDCPAIKSSGDIFDLAPLVNGIVIVIEAGKTRIDQIFHTERSIEFARGKIIGYILNERSVNIPNLFYKILS